MQDTDEIALGERLMRSRHFLFRNDAIHFALCILHFAYSTVTDFARFLGWSTSFPKNSAM